MTTTRTWQPQKFPVQVTPGFSAHAVARSDGTQCPNTPGGYVAQGVRQPPERPILYDAFNEMRGNPPVPHRALDITCAEGSVIAATNAGVVPMTVQINGETHPGAGNSPKGGNYVFVKESSGFTQYYAHMRDFPMVSPGDTISANQQLGYCGRTGNAAPGCPHLHFAVTDPTGQKINPTEYVRPLYDAGGWKRASSYTWVFWTLGLGIAGYFSYRAIASRVKRR